MSETETVTEDYDEPGLYEIHVMGRLTDRWVNWFEGLTMTPGENGSTFLTGSVVDQAALYGLLRKVRDLGMPLISVNRRQPDQADASANKHGSNIVYQKEKNDG